MSLNIKFKFYKKYNNNKTLNILKNAEFKNYHTKSIINILLLIKI